MKCFIVVLYIFLFNSLFSQKWEDSVSIFFNFDSEIPISSELAKLSGLDVNSDIDVLVGYTDTIGSTAYNYKLAKRRAEYIKNKIPNNGSIRVEVIGENSLFSQNKNNRRVDVFTKKHVVIDSLILNVSFIPGEAVILPGSYNKIEELNNIILTSHFKEIQLHGHVCCNNNYSLSLERANKIKSKLISLGIESYLIKCFGHGNSFPIAYENNNENRQKNRRVEVIIIR